ncbi:MAG: MFS transporter [archaeon]|nr:MFS transporter [archaeon]MCR4323707.1 MFS transporter [Nanoarchaeota archaeon]
MGILMRLRGGRRNLTVIGRLAIVLFIIALSSAYLDTIWAVYLDSFLKDASLVGFVSAVLTIISFISYFLIIPLIEKHDKAKIYLISLFLSMIFYILFSINENFFLFILLAALLTIMYTLRISSLGIIIRDNSKNKEVSSNEGLLYTFGSVAWLIGPLIAGYVASMYGIPKVFLLAAVFIFIGLILFKSSNIKDPKGKERIDSNMLKNFLDFFKDKKRAHAYILGGGVNLWWTFIYLFIPLMIIRSGLGDLWIGYFLFAVAIPLIALDYIFAKSASKKGFKSLFQTGYLIVSIISFICFFVPNIYVILSLLVLASIGMAMVEPTTEAYFFDILKGKEKYRFYSPYNTTIDVAGFIGKLSAAILLIFLPFKYLFILFAVFMFLLFLTASKVKKVIESNRK